MSQNKVPGRQVPHSQINYINFDQALFIKISESVINNFPWYRSWNQAKFWYWYILLATMCDKTVAHPGGVSGGRNPTFGTQKIT